MIRIKLKGYQKQGVSFISKCKGRVLLADEQGLGKTAQVLQWCHDNIYNNNGLTIVICPATIKEKWQHEAQSQFGMMATILQGRKPSVISPVALDALKSKKIIILNYDILPSWRAQLGRLKPKLIVVDECQKISNPANKQTKACKKLCEKAPHVIMVSGTPFMNDPIGIWSALNILKPSVFPNYHAFGLRYTNAESTPWGWVYKGARNQKELHGKLKKLMIRRLEKDVQKLPPLSRKVVLVEMEKRREYVQLMEDFHNWLARMVRGGYLGRGKMKRALKAAILTKMGYARRFVAENKVRSIIRWIRERLSKTTGKMIVFGLHRKVLRPLFEEFKHCSVIIDGKIATKDRHQITNKFNNDKRIRILFGNMQAAGAGWNGTAATTVVKVELAWNPGTHSQCEKRAHRFGQDKPVRVYYLVAERTIEEKLCSLIQKKQIHFSEVMDGTEICDAPAGLLNKKRHSHELTLFQDFVNTMVEESTKKKKKGRLDYDF